MKSNIEARRMTPSRLKTCGIYGSIALVTALATLLAVRARAAGIPDADVFTYTGYLEDADGQPLQSTVSIAVELWTDGKAGAGDKVCEAVAETVELQAGRFQVPLTDCDAEVKKNPNLWTEVRVDGASLGRTKLGAVPYAIEAAHATSADEATHAKSADTATHALTTAVRKEISASTEFGAACFADPTVWNCAVAADLRCQALGYVTGWVQGDWGSSKDATTRQIVCLK